MPGLGERFRLAREERGISLSEAAEQIRIRSVYLSAIEDETWSTIGAAVYIRGFIRTYARYLGIDPEEAIEAFNSTQPAGGAPSNYAARESVREGGRSRWGGLAIWVTGVVAVLLVAFVVYNELTLRRGAERVAASSPPAATPVASASPGAQASPGASASPGAAGSPAAAAVPPAPGDRTIALLVVSPTWLRLTVDGDVSMEGTFPAGTSQTFRGKNASVRLGNAGGVEIYVDGKDVGKLGTSGDVVERSFNL